MIEKLQLFGRRIDLLAVHQQLIAVEVDDQLIKLQPLFRIVGDLAAAQHGVNTGHQFLHFKGLDQIVVCAHLKARDAVIHIALGRQHDDGGSPLLADMGAHSPAVHDGQHNIQQHHVGCHGVKFFHRLATVVGNADFKTLFFQIHADEIGNIAIIFHH